MKDKLTGKRVKVDYLLIISILGLESDFFKYQFDRKVKISLRRQALAFLSRKKVNIADVWTSCLENGLTSYDDWYSEQCRIAKTPWLDED